MNRFFDLLLQAVDSGDPGWLKPLLIDWSVSRTETELQNEEITLSPVLTTVVTETYFVARDELEPPEVVLLMETLLPIFIYCYEEVAQHETLVRIGYISTQLQKVQDELERLDRSKSDFISVAAHELKTPLTLIEGYNSMMREQFTGVEAEKMLLLLLRGIDNGTRRLGEIIDDMIDVSMIDNNLLSLNFQPTWVNRLLDVLVREFEDSLNERNLHLKVRSFPGSDEMTFADPERIYQALKNIMANAIKFTPDGGKITIDGRKLSGFIEITVKDTGIGIDSEDQAIIFQKFGRLGDAALHSSGKTKFKGGGPGLGLPITKGILEAHGGTIWVESEGYNESDLPGTTFHILLPLRDSPPDDKVAKLFQPLSGNEPADKME
ncbi:sensor histidine kinase [Chloroflexota bacterium]